MRLPRPDNFQDVFALALIETAQIIIVWVVALEAFKWLDWFRLRFRPRDYWAWLQTPEGGFAEYVARVQREKRDDEAN